MKADGSGKVLLRTRTHLRKILPATRNGSHDVGDIQSPPPDQPTTPLLIPGTLQDGTSVIDPVDAGTPEDSQEALDTINDPSEDALPPTVVTPPTLSTTRPSVSQIVDPPPAPRRVREAASLPRGCHQR